MTGIDEGRVVAPEETHALVDVAVPRQLGSQDLAQAHAALMLDNERLSRANERLAAFAGQVSHDLKNPLTAIAMSLEMIEDEVADNGDLALLVGRARRGADRMRTMIEGLLVFAGSGQAPTQDPVDLAVEMAHVLDDVVGTLAPDCVWVGDLPVVPGEAVQLRAVLQNLLDNAAKFTPAGRRPEVTVSARRGEGHWRIEVADRGSGIPEQERERVFEPLTRLDRSIEGVGIGLATCRRIVEAHRGRIGIEENPGGGTIAWFELPGV